MDTTKFAYFILDHEHLKRCLQEGLHFVEYIDKAGRKVYRFSHQHASDIRASMRGAHELTPEQVESAGLRPKFNFK